MSKLKNSNWDKTQKLKLWQNSKTEIVTNLNYQKSQFEKKKTLKVSFSKNILTHWQPMRCSVGSVLQFLRCFNGLDSIWIFKDWSLVIGWLPKTGIYVFESEPSLYSGWIYTGRVVGVAVALGVGFKCFGATTCTHWVIHCFRMQDLLNLICKNFNLSELIRNKCINLKAL